MNFDHWLSDLRPRRLTPEELDAKFQILPTDPKAREEIILSHFRLGMSIVAKVLNHYPNKVDVLVAEMLYMLVIATDRIKEPGAISSYIGASVEGHLKNVAANDRVLGRKGRRRKCDTIKDDDAMELGFLQTRAKELFDLIITRCRTKMEVSIVFLRLTGLKDVEISQMIGVSQPKIGKIRNEIFERIKCEL